MNFGVTMIFCLHFNQVRSDTIDSYEKVRFVCLDQGNRSISASATKQRRSTNLLSNKPLPLPTPPTIETPKTPKVRATMLQNVLTQIEQGQTMKSEK